MPKVPMVKMVTATEAKNRFGEMIKDAYLNDEHLIVKRDGIPVVAIISIQDYTRLVMGKDLPQELAETLQTESQAGQARAQLQSFLDTIHRKLPPIADEETEQDIQEAIKAVRSSGR
jgi:prevent-host-death family protein